ncbi:conserved hypothetical protein [Denitrovibrio acetiphilus DSM 12809]|uniref:DUF445 domain-containing protein n=1 Tax=Denitrovibrio acetiphilus (strain DSM 12809 / NBRC 114555 / N2460) TaxID=522772 RepID=D4H8I8_DENA2|nr:DUF445 family protein [Denitrovibrio acetiphilus]ADD68337.1 conserved hypothetical protein [Denitrovibrio acetiphilus DSM 12809]
MQSQMYSLLATPLVTGLVGYCTNWLAIKMLFRPHKKSVFSLGWQGVIPKNRQKLAGEIGALVGDKLLRTDDIQSAFFSENMQDKLERAIETELKTFMEKDFGTLEQIIEKTGLKSKTAITALLGEINSDGVLDSFFHGISEKISSEIYSMKIGELEEYTENIKSAVNAVLSTGKIQAEASNSISASINNFVMSGKSLTDIIPESLTAKTGQLSGFITNKILDAMDKAMADPATRKKVSKQLINIKNSHFKDGAVDQLKLGVLNMFMTEDTIDEMVDKYLPNLITSVKDSEEVKKKIAMSINDYITGILKKPLFMHADTLGMEALFQLRSSVVTAARGTLDSSEFSSKMSGMIIGMIKQNSEKTLGELLDELQLKDALDAKLANGFSLKIQDAAEFLTKMASGLHIRNIYSVVPKKLFYAVKIALLKEINKIVEKNSPKMLEAINFPKITEDRINTLNLYEVENLLFSFMRDSFRWINILGFIIGFLLGAVQIGVTYLLG